VDLCRNEAERAVLQGKIAKLPGGLSIEVD
jgi:hypothetical protein